MSSIHTAAAVTPAVKDAKAARKSQRPEGPASILSFGTANPPTVQNQSTYPDYYFHVTGSDHMVELKHKFRRISEKTTIKKRHTSLTDDLLMQNPNLCSYASPSLDIRQQIATTAIPTMAAAASSKAIHEWGLDRSLITHIVFCTTSTTDLPGADHRLLRLLELRPSVQRILLTQHGCSGGATVLRIAKDIAENNRDARVLAVCAETAAIIFWGPSEDDPDSLVRMALFGYGGAAMVIGDDPDDETKKPIFEIISAVQTILPESDGCVVGQLREVGLVFQLERNLPELVGRNMRRIVVEELGARDCNSLFWAVHPGGPAILQRVEWELGLERGKLEASRRVLEQYGNMSSATVLFVLEEMRRKSHVEGLGMIGEGCELGMLIGFGPGVTVGSVVLQSVAL